MIRVLLAEDQAMLRGALAALLRLEDDINVLDSCPDGDTAWAQAQRLRPDVIIADIEMPGLTGIELARRVKDSLQPCKVIIVTTFARAGYLRRALEAGVAGYLLKDASPEELAHAVRTVHAGGRAITPQLAVDAWIEPDPLNERERQLLRLAGEGLSSAEIADRLGLARGTVRNYLSEATGKLHARNRIEAYQLARQKGWL